MIANHNRSGAKQRRKRLAGVAAVIVILIALGAAFTLKSGYFVPDGWTWERISWRAQLFARKAEGAIPDLSWRELWFMTHARGGFGLDAFVKTGISLDGMVVNPFTTNADRQSGAGIFRERCAVCHGEEGTGGHAPPLNRS